LQPLADLVERLYETSVEPERLAALIEDWDRRIAVVDPTGVTRLDLFGDHTLARHVERALDILERLNTAELQRADELLAGLRSAAMVLTERGVVVAANQPAHVVFGLFPSANIRTMPFPKPELAELADRVAAVVASGLDEVVQLRPSGLGRAIVLHLKPIGGRQGPRQVLAVSSEHVWTDEVTAVLVRAFGLTPAEVAVLRQLTAGETVAGIAQATGRREGTIRTQLHTLLAKTGARTQAELMRIATLLLNSVPCGVEPSRPPPFRPSGRRHRLMHLPDGRRMDVVTYGAPAGRPLIWLMSTLGMHLMPVSAEHDLVRRNIRVLVPIRAGYGVSDPSPPGRDPFDLAVEDTRELIRRLGVPSLVVVAPTDDIRIALMLAHAEPERIGHIIGIGSGFPILTTDQYDRMHAIGRFFRACARYTPAALPFITKAFRAITMRYGIDGYFHATLRAIPGDGRAFANREVADAVAAGFAYTFGTSLASESAFCAELVRFHQNWPPGLGDVGCPVTLIHGEQDGNAPYQTALEYCAMYPKWRYVGFPDEGQLVAHARWPEVFDIVEAAMAGPAALKALVAKAAFSDASII
jgi:pimeloyl-ACP methyl ester carboxylesterase/DNA-binding CsgD family transcriptional regulator